jgi:hypothetical protein
LLLTYFSLGVLFSMVSSGSLREHLVVRHPRSLVFAAREFFLLPRDDLLFIESIHLVPEVCVFSFEAGHSARVLYAAWYCIPRLACAHRENVSPDLS